MSRLEGIKNQLRPGKVYRRQELGKWSKSIDRDLDALLKDGSLKKLSQGLYYHPKQSAFGATPPEEHDIVRGFLKDDRFLITSPNSYNALGVGTTQLHNIKIVYNHKRHGEIMLGNRSFLFQMKHHFPKTVTPEFLLVDLVNNIDRLAEDNQSILDNALEKAKQFNATKLKHAVKNYGTLKTQKLFMPMLYNSHELSYAG
jgi:hypothetical protein